MDKSSPDIKVLEAHVEDIWKKNVFWLRTALISLVAAAIAFIGFMPKELYTEHKSLRQSSLFLLFFVLFAVIHIILWYRWDIYRAKSVSKQIQEKKQAGTLKEWFTVTAWKWISIVAHLFLYAAVICLLVGIILAIIFFRKEYF